MAGMASCICRPNDALNSAFSSPPVDPKAQSMLARVLDSLCLQVVRSPACGWAVRTIIVLSSKRASAVGAAADGRTGLMVPVR
jgi:hypothetical protein